VSLLSPVTSILTSVAGAPLKAAAGVGLSAVSGFIVAGAEAMLGEVVKLIGLATTPSLSVSWFSTRYWRLSALATLLTVPFLFAAAVQAIIRTDLGVLLRAALVDLPIAALAVTIAAPLVTLLLAATDEMCALVTGGNNVDGTFLITTSGDLKEAGGGFLLIIIAVVILLAGMVLLVELVMRAAAIYIVVLFLPLGFAAMVWPARRVWIKRMLETLIALILSKFAMVAILSLAVAGLASFGTHPSPVTTALVSMALIVMAAFSPWALLRLLPFTELAAEARGMLRRDTQEGTADAKQTLGTAATLGAGLIVDPAVDAFSGLRRFASNGADFGSGGRGAGTRSGMSVLRSGSGAELPPGPDGHSGPPNFDGETPGDGGQGDGAPGGGGPDGSSGGGSGGAAIWPADSGDAGAQMNSSSGQAPRPAAPLAAGTAEPSPGEGPGTNASAPPITATAAPPPSTPAPGTPTEHLLGRERRGPVEDAVPLLHPDNERMQVSLGPTGRDSLGLVNPPEAADQGGDDHGAEDPA
jgi:hypothetical protein